MVILCHPTLVPPLLCAVVPPKRGRVLLRQVDREEEPAEGVRVVYLEIPKGGCHMLK